MRREKLYVHEWDSVRSLFDGFGFRRSRVVEIELRGDAS